MSAIHASLRRVVSARALFTVADALAGIALAASAIKSRVLVAAWRVEDGDPCSCGVAGAFYDDDRAHLFWCARKRGVR